MRRTISFSGFPRALKMSLIDFMAHALVSARAAEPLIVRSGCKCASPLSAKTRFSIWSTNKDQGHDTFSFSNFLQNELPTWTKDSSFVCEPVRGVGSGALKVPHLIPTASLQPKIARKAWKCTARITARASPSICSTSGDHRRDNVSSYPRRQSRRFSTVSEAVRDLEGEEELTCKSDSYDFKAYVGGIKKKMAVTLDQAIPVSHPEIVAEAMRYTLLSDGKRICPILCIAACELVGGSQDKAIPVACGLEMVYSAHLIHDDLPCVDDGDVRRGLPANHKKFGEGVAVYAGDALLVNAFEHIAKNTGVVDPEKLLRTIVLIGSGLGLKGMAGGQVLDLLNTNNLNVGLDGLDDIHLHKTARLAEVSAMSGAVLGGGSEEEIQKLGLYGRTLGLLVQVVDDILDLTGSPAQLGKAVGKDAQADKATYHKFLGLEQTRTMAANLNRRAKEHIKDFDEQRAAPLLDLADFLLARGNK